MQPERESWCRLGRSRIRQILSVLHWKPPDLLSAAWCIGEHLNISPHQLSYVTHSGEGEGLLFYGNVILPFVDRFPTDLELYRIMTTKLTEVQEAKEA